MTKWDFVGHHNRKTARRVGHMERNSSGLHTTHYSTRAYPATHAVNIQQQSKIVAEASCPLTSQQPENPPEKFMRTDRPPPRGGRFFDRPSL